MTEITNTELPWFVSGVRLKMNDQEWLGINRYNPETKQDENMAIVGYDPRTGEGTLEAKLIVKAVNAYPNYQAMRDALEGLQKQALQSDLNDPTNEWGREAIEIANAALADGGK